MKKQFTLFLLLVSTTFAFANTAKKESLDVEKAEFSSVQDTLKPIKKAAETWKYDDPDCPKEKPIHNICNAVLDPEDENGERSYIAGIKKAACVRPTDSKEVEGEKIRIMWNKYEDKLVCDSLFFPVTGGNIIKATIYKGNKDFMKLIFEWKVNLNRVDVDGRTALDYVDDQIKRETTPAAISMLKYFKRHLEHYGAKRKSEL